VGDARPTRQARLRERLQREGLTGLIVTHPANIRYLTGFTGSSGAVLAFPDETVLVTDTRYEAQAPREVGDLARTEVVRADVWERVVREVQGARGRVQSGGWGIEAESVTLATARKLADLGLPDLTPVTGLVEDLRAVKDRQEIEAIRAAATLAQEALAAALPAIRPGIREIDVAAALESALRLRGSEWHPFPTIVASGPRSALPHARTSGRVIERDELVLLDFGAQVDGYCADLTRVVVAGRADPRQRAMHGLVEEAQRAAIDGLRAGLTGRQGDALARRIIEERGFGTAFGHSLGHGLGLELHEAPRLSHASEAVLPDGCVVTVEPGVYFPGWGGIRLEDDVRLTTEGAELLSDGKIELVETMG
jgi:Xaa-Pro aminopeptidase